MGKNGTDNGLNNPISIPQPGGNYLSYGQEYYMLSNGQMLHVYNANGKEYLNITYGCRA